MSEQDRQEETTRNAAAETVSAVLVELERLAVLSYRQARRLIIFVIGTTVLLIGVVLLFVPGPAFVVIPVGIAILSAEFAWARRVLHHAKDTLATIHQRVMRAQEGGEPADEADAAAQGPVPESEHR